MLFDAAFQEGEKISKAYGGKDWNKFITDFFSAIGFGDIAILDAKNPKIGLIYYPWTKLLTDSKHTIIRGLLSGIISECIGQKINLELLNTDARDFLTITLGVKQ